MIAVSAWDLLIVGAIAVVLLPVVILATRRTITREHNAAKGEIKAALRAHDFNLIDLRPARFLEHPFPRLTLSVGDASVHGPGVRRAVTTHWRVAVRTRRGVDQVCWVRVRQPPVGPLNLDWAPTIREMTVAAAPLRAPRRQLVERRRVDWDSGPGN